MFSYPIPLELGRRGAVARINELLLDLAENNGIGPATVRREQASWDIIVDFSSSADAVLFRLRWLG